MPRNVEIKARIDSVDALLAHAQPLADGPPERIEQDDTFFHCAHGRLKLRDFGNGRGELIHYERPDTDGPKVSDYVRTPTSDPAALRDALTRAHGQLGRVRKTRLLLLAGQTRIHLDRVQGLGDFMELEVVLRDEQTLDQGQAIAEGLMQQLGIDASQRLACAYLDLLSPSATAAGTASAK
jgi:predicted adenylyl cyclase CyaB